MKPAQRIAAMEAKLKELGQETFLNSLKPLGQGRVHQKSQKAAKKQQRLFESAQFRKVAFRLAYIGMDYLGLESQGEEPKTIEFQIFRVIEKLSLIRSRTESEYTRAGRTDKGVSAIGNVISLLVRTSPGSNELEAERMNRLLPEEIRVTGQCDVSKDFSARYNCIRRIYKYFFFRELMNIEIMREASKQFLGEHDFRNFCKLDVVANQNFVRTVFSIQIDEVIDPVQPFAWLLFKGDERLQLFCITVEGNAFLWHQIRCMAQVLFLIGRGKEQSSVISSLLAIDESKGKPAYGLAPEHQLVLYDCQYPEGQVNFGQQPDTLLVGVYNQMRTSLTNGYMRLMLLGRIGLTAMEGREREAQEKSVAMEQIKLREQKAGKSLMEQQHGVTVQSAIESLKGRRKQMYDIKMQRVQEYEERVAKKVKGDEEQLE